MKGTLLKIVDVCSAANLALRIFMLAEWLTEGICTAISSFILRMLNQISITLSTKSLLRGQWTLVPNGLYEESKVQSS